MKEKESTHIRSHDGLQLNYEIKTVESPIALVCIFHGHGEHLGRYDHVVDYLNSMGVSCIAVDWRGHGRSEGKKGHLPSLNHVLNDIEEVLKLARLTHLDAPLFLFGHSFGGCMVLNYVLRRPTMELAGFVAASPWLALAFQPPSWKVKLGRVMSKLLPKFSQPTDLDPNHLSRNEETVEAYRKDALVHDRMSARFYTEVNAAGNFVLNTTETFSLKGLVYHGSGDQIISFDATAGFAQHHSELDFHEFDGFYHEPHNDEGKESVLKLLGDWILQSTKSAS